MADLTNIRGWLYYPAYPMYEQVRRIVERHVENGPYGDLWVLPRDPCRRPFEYVFLGGEVRTAAVPYFRDTVRTIAETVLFIDEVSRHAVEGYFRWDSDGGESGEWVCGKGRFVERSIPTSYGWSLDPDPDGQSGPEGG